MQYPKYWLLILGCLLANSLGAQRIIIPEPPIPRPTAGLFELELQEIRISTNIDQGIATTSLEQVFFNPTRHQLQGMYLFPVPENANYQDFRMEINGVETKGELLEADKARQIFEEIVRKSLDPALLEYMGKDMLQVRIFPIQPQQKQTIRLTFRHLLPLENGIWEYDLPIGSRTNEAKALQSLVADISIQTTKPLKNIFSPTHQVDITRTAPNTARIGMEAEDAPLLSRFKLYFQEEDASVGATIHAFKEPGDRSGYFMLQFNPGVETKLETVEKDITFVLDASGSMDGPKMDKAKEALHFCVQQLQPSDRFNIIRFSTVASSLFDRLEPANTTNQEEAADYIQSLEAVGGTNIEEALSDALSLGASSERPYFIIFLTDGKPTIGEINTEQLLKNLQAKNTKNTRIFTFGIGTELNTQLLDKLTEAAKGYRTYVLPEEDIEVKVTDFYQKVAYPVLTDLEVQINGKKLSIEDLYPRSLPDLFRGSTLTLLGRYEGAGSATILLKGTQNGKLKAYEYELDFPDNATDHDFVPGLWGARSVGYLLDQIRLNGENQELVDEVVRLSKKFGIITPYTSYLILEDEALRIGANSMSMEEAILSPRTQAAEEPIFQDQSTQYEEGMKKAEGEESVRASAGIQNLNSSTNIAQSQKERSRLYYEDSNGNTRNLSDGIQNIQGRAQYLNNNRWLDAALWESDNQNLPEKRIEFNSKAYFELLQNEPESANFLSLGRNVRFVLNGVIWEVYEK